MTDYASLETMEHQVLIESEEEDMEEEEEEDDDKLDPMVRKLLKLEKKSLSTKSINGKCSIQKIPHLIRQRDENACVPQVVSIGPFHRSNESLQAMNDMKNKYLFDVITWNIGDSQPQVEILNRYLTVVKSVEGKARGCYSEPINPDSDDDFIQMMVIDGCFIIGLLCKVGRLIPVDYDDPIFSTIWLWSDLRKDLMMLENQIPFIVLKKLLKQMVWNNRPSLTSLALVFFKGLVPGIQMSIKEKKPKHLLHLFQSSLVPMPKQHNQNERERNRDNHINQTSSVTALTHSVMALTEDGIKFKKAKSPDSFFDVKFNKGTMEIPAFMIHRTTFSLFLNLIAFEQCYNNCTKHFTAYTAFMNCLINSPKDVRILCKSGIVQDLLGNSDEDLARQFKMLGRDHVITSNNGSYFSNIFFEVNLSKSKRNACKASLKRFYFKSRWAIIPFAAAFILLVATIIQTIFTVISYFHQP